VQFLTWSPGSPLTYAKRKNLNHLPLTLEPRGEISARTCMKPLRPRARSRSYRAKKIKREGPQKLGVVGERRKGKPPLLSRGHAHPSEKRMARRLHRAPEGEVKPMESSHCDGGTTSTLLHSDQLPINQEKSKAGSRSSG